MPENKVFLGLSGGIDSAMSALLLREKGYDVTGVVLRMHPSSGDQHAVRELARRLEIPLVEMDVQQVFEQTVVDYFLQSYLDGQTPSACTVCNAHIKWHYLERAASLSGCPDALIATGHYCHVIRHDDHLYIAKGSDPLKDQSYYLWMVPQELLHRMLLPLGAFRKADIKAEMIRRGFSDLAAKKESMGTCFLPTKNYADFLLSRLPQLQSLEGGEVVDTGGRVIGTHRGYPFYTLAQRKGLQLADKDLCVVGIEKERNRLIAGSADDLYRSRILLRDCRISCAEEFFNSDRLQVKVRGVGVNPRGFVTVRRAQAQLVVDLKQPAWAVMQGQPVVFYIDDRVVGGGIVQEAFR